MTRAAMAASAEFTWSNAALQYEAFLGLPAAYLGFMLVF